MTINTSNTTTTNTSHNLVGNALQLLAVGLGPYVVDRLREASGRGRYVPDDIDTIGDVETDVAVMLRVMASGWHEVFREVLGPMERSLVSETREIRNRWAHMDAFDDDDLDRALDSIGRLLDGIGAGDEAERVHRAKHRLRTRRYAPEKSGAKAAAQADDSVEYRPDPGSSRSAPHDYDTLEVASSHPDPASRSADPLEMPRTPGVDYGDRSMAIIEQGIANRQKGDFGRAIADFGEAIGVNRENADAWYHRGLTWGHMGEFRRAINDFNRVIALDIGYADAYNGRGYARYCLEDYTSAVSDFEHALLLDPDDQLTRINLEKARVHIT